MLASSASATASKRRHGGVFCYCYSLVGATDAQGDVGLLRVHFVSCASSLLCWLVEVFGMMLCVWRAAQHTSRGDEDGLWRTDDGLPGAHDV